MREAKGTTKKATSDMLEVTAFQKSDAADKAALNTAKSAAEGQKLYRVKVMNGWAWTKDPARWDEYNKGRTVPENRGANAVRKKNH